MGGNVIRDQSGNLEDKKSCFHIKQFKLYPVGNEKLSIFFFQKRSDLMDRYTQQ